MGDSPRSVALERGGSEAIEVSLKREVSTAVSVDPPLVGSSWSPKVDSPSSRNGNSRSSSYCTTSEEDAGSSDDNLDSRSPNETSGTRPHERRNRSLTKLQLRRMLRIVTSSELRARDPCQIQPETTSPPHSTQAKELNGRTPIASFFAEPNSYLLATPDSHRAPASNTSVEEGRAGVGEVVPTPLPVNPISLTPKSLPREETSTEHRSEDETPGRGVHVASPSPEQRPREEADIEEGGEPATTSTDMNRAAGPQASAPAAVDVTVSTASTDTTTTIVLPCAPSDEEKVMYHRSGRAFVLTAGMLAFIALSAGMWLFALTSNIFLWYAVPSVFMTIYIAGQYLAVAIWGKDFDEEAHKERVKKAAGEGHEPTVDVFLPVCNEPVCILANTWDHVTRLDYPHLKVFVLDDGGSDEVRDLAASYGFEYFRRPNRPELKKAGNLRYAFGQTSSDAIVILDADFCPRTDFLRETLPYLMDPKIGIIQTPQYFRWREEQTWIEQGAGVTQEFFYRLVQVNQDVFGGSCCAGSCAVYRRAALEPLGGVVAAGHSEDIITGFKIAGLGYKLKYLPMPMSMGTCPDEPRSFFMQQYRWCTGTMTLVSMKDFWNSSTTVMHKICVLNGLLYYVASALVLFIAPLPMLLLIWFYADGILWIHSLFVIPAIVFAAIVLPIWSKQRWAMSCHRVKVIQCYAHLYAVWDHVMGRTVAWVPSGGGASRSSSKTYRSSTVLLIVWNTLVTVLIIGGSFWRMTTHTWYHFVPAMVLFTGSFFLNISTLLR